MTTPPSIDIDATILKLRAGVDYQCPTEWADGTQILLASSRSTHETLLECLRELRAINARLSCGTAAGFNPADNGGE